MEFTVEELSMAMSQLPTIYGRVGQLGLFVNRPQVLTTVQIESRGDTLSLVPTTPWGGPAPKNQLGKRKLRTFGIPHRPLEDVVKAAEVMGVRAFGTQNTLETVNNRILEKLQNMKNKHDITLEYSRMSALKGILVDADGAVLENYFTSFDVTEQTLDFDLDDVNTDVRAKCVEITRLIEDGLEGETMTGVHGLVSPEFFDAFISHKQVKETYLNWAESARVNGGDLRKGFTFGGLTIEEYRGRVGATRFIAAGEAHFFPLGTQESFATWLAPADFNDTVNTLALPYYARMEGADFNRGTNLHTQANHLPMVMRPKVLVRGYANQN